VELGFVNFFQRGPFNFVGISKTKLIGVIWKPLKFRKKIRGQWRAIAELTQGNNTEIAPLAEKTMAILMRDQEILRPKKLLTFSHQTIFREIIFYRNKIENGRERGSGNFGKRGRDNNGGESIISSEFFIFWRRTGRESKYIAVSEMRTGTGFRQ